MAYKFILGPCRLELQLATVIGYVENQHPIKAHAICLNSFSINFAQGSGHKREQNYGGISYI